MNMTWFHAALSGEVCSPQTAGVKILDALRYIVRRGKLTFIANGKGEIEVTSSSLNGVWSGTVFPIQALFLSECPGEYEGGTRFLWHYFREKLFREYTTRPYNRADQIAKGLPHRVMLPRHLITTERTVGWLVIKSSLGQLFLNRMVGEHYLRLELKYIPRGHALMVDLPRKQGGSIVAEADRNGFVSYPAQSPEATFVRYLMRKLVFDGTTVEAH